MERETKREAGFDRELIATATDPQVADVGNQLIEVVADQLPALLAEIPGLGWIVKLVKAGFDINNVLFLRKLGHFYSGAGAATDRARRDFREKVNEDPEYARKVGEQVLLLLSRTDSFAKAEMIGKVFAAFVSGKIPEGMFQRLVGGIDRCPLSDLEDAMNDRFEKTYGVTIAPENGEQFAVTYRPAESLFLAGLAEPYLQDANQGTFYTLSGEGRILLRILNGAL